MNIDKFTSTIAVPFNQSVEKRSLDAFTVGYNQMSNMAKKLEIKPPSKGKFASDIIRAGLEATHIETYLLKSV